MSSSPALGNGSYAVLFLWGAFGICFIIVAFLLVCTSLGRPLKRRLSRLRPKGSEKSGQYNTSELEAHKLEFCTPHPLGTPAPPYEWVLRITPPPPPTAHFPSAVAHITPTLTHRFSDIPRVPSNSGHGLGIQVNENLLEEKDITKTFEEIDNLHSRNPSGCTKTKQAALASNLGQVTSLPLSVAEGGNVSKATEGAERQARQDRYRALLLQSNEQTRREILKGMPEEDRVIALAL